MVSDGKCLACGHGTPGHGGLGCMPWCGCTEGARAIREQQAASAVAAAAVFEEEARMDVVDRRRLRERVRATYPILDRLRQPGDELRRAEIDRASEEHGLSGRPIGVHLSDRSRATIIGTRGLSSLAAERAQFLGDLMNSLPYTFQSDVGRYIEAHLDETPFRGVTNVMATIRQLRNASPPPREGPKLSRSAWQAIRDAQHGLCFDCDADGPLTKGHLVPYSMGGAEDAKNIVGQCRRCNFTQTKNVHIEAVRRGLVSEKRGVQYYDPRNPGYYLAVVSHHLHKSFNLPPPFRKPYINDETDDSIVVTFHHPKRTRLASSERKALATAGLLDREAALQALGACVRVSLTNRSKSELDRVFCVGPHPADAKATAKIVAAHLLASYWGVNNTGEMMRS
jgi:hypothetical protein